MRVQVKLFATLSVYWPRSKPGMPFSIEISEGSTISDLMEKLNIPESEVKLSFVNGRLMPHTHKLTGGDDVGIFPPIGGG